MLPDEHSLEDIAVRLARELADLASQLNPFPAFMDMITIQAIELEPLEEFRTDRGCVVVTPDGGIRQLDLTFLTGAPGVGELSQVEEFLDLDLPLDEYIAYVQQAIQLLTDELERRGSR